MSYFLNDFSPSRRLLFGLTALAILLVATPLVSAESTRDIKVVNDADGSRLVVDGQDYMVLGMNWDYVPIGENYAYALWNQPDDMIRTALDREMQLLKAMGVNTIRHYVGIPPRWVKYIYENYQIYTVLNHAMGRYGVTIDGVYMPTTDYSDPRTRETLLNEIADVVTEYRGVPGILMWQLGNENNYGLSWKSAETEALPEGERQAAKARYLYSLFSEAIDRIKAIDDSRPVAISNGDLQYIDVIAQEVKNMDVLSTNVYRGISFRDLFDVVKEKLGVPVLFGEFGADAFNAKEMREDQYNQARYLLGQWQEIYEQSAGKGLAGNSIGGMTFQFSDGWWKYLQDANLDVHDVNASWPNGGYPEDLEPGENNMNEEWWGICAKGFPDQSGLYELYPRAAYYALKEVNQLDPYAPETDLEKIKNHFAAISPMAAVLAARGDRAALKSEATGKIRVSGARIEMETVSTGGDFVETPDTAATFPDSYPSFMGFDHMESFYTEFEAKPADNVLGKLTLNYIGHIPENPIDEIFYENRGRSVTVAELNDQAIVENKRLEGLERLKVYSASISWASKNFQLDGFYRTGHYHWGYEGDFFGLYREANYGPNIDIYNADAPLGFEMAFKKSLSGLKVAMGQELWWGANPAILFKYQKNFGSLQTAFMYQEDLDDQSTPSSSIAVPLPRTRKASAYFATNKGPLLIEVGGIWSGENKEGQEYVFVEGSPGNYDVLEDNIEASDALGGKFKLSMSYGRWNWYLQGAAMGLVADGGPTAVQTFTGWRLKDSGKGNQNNIITGFTYLTGNFQIAPNFLWQKPVVGPIPGDVPGWLPRNVLDDPFAVRENRETVAGELLITYDPTPATWMYQWDNDVREDARLAVSAGFVFRHFPTTQDAAIGILEDGRTPFAFEGAPRARDLWELYTRIVSKLRPGLGFVANLYGGTGEPNGDDNRLVHRYGGDVRFVSGTTKLITSAKFNDWGPYDYHRDGNITYPIQFMVDISTNVGSPTWFELPQTKFGVRVTWRSLDRYSARYIYSEEALADQVDVDFDSFPDGHEWEIRTYLHLSVGM